MIQQVSLQGMCATGWIRYSYQYNSKPGSINNTSAHGKTRGCRKRNRIDPLIEFYAVKLRMLSHAVS